MALCCFSVAVGCNDSGPPNEHRKRIRETTGGRSNGSGTGASGEATLEAAVLPADPLHPAGRNWREAPGGRRGDAPPPAACQGSTVTTPAFACRASPTRSASSQVINCSHIASRTAGASFWDLRAVPRRPRAVPARRRSAARNCSVSPRLRGRPTRAGARLPALREATTPAHALPACRPAMCNGGSGVRARALHGVHERIAKCYLNYMEPEPAWVCSPESITAVAMRDGRRLCPTGSTAWEPDATEVAPWRLRTLAACFSHPAALPKRGRPPRIAHPFPGRPSRSSRP